MRIVASCELVEEAYSGAHRRRSGGVPGGTRMPVGTHPHLLGISCNCLFMFRNFTRLPLFGSLALGAQHGKLDAELSSSTLLGTPSAQSVHE
jgi:hypothetical protein